MDSKDEASFWCQSGRRIQSDKLFFLPSKNNSTSEYFWQEGVSVSLSSMNKSSLLTFIELQVRNIICYSKEMVEKWSKKFSKSLLPFVLTDSNNNGHLFEKGDWFYYSFIPWWNFEANFWVFFNLQFEKDKRQQQPNHKKHWTEYPISFFNIKIKVLIQHW